MKPLTFLLFRNEARPGKGFDLIFDEATGLEIRTDVVAVEQAEPLDITDFVNLEGIGSINRAAEREILSFRTGDVTLSLRDSDGSLAAVFDELDVTTRWTLQITQAERVLFTGIILPLGSVTRNEKEREIEITAYGATKVLDESDASLVRRIDGDFSLTADAAASAELLSTDVPSGGTTWLEGDEAILTDQTNNEKVTVKQASNNGQDIELEAPIQNAYLTGSRLIHQTLGNRLFGVQTLIEELFLRAQIPVAEIVLGSLTAGGFRFAGPSPLQINGLHLADYAFAAPAEHVETDNAAMSLWDQPLGLEGHTYYHKDPDDDWGDYDIDILSSTTRARPFIDWSPWFLQTDKSSVTVTPRHVEVGPLQVDSNIMSPGTNGFDLRNMANMIQYRIKGSNLESRTSADGDTWTAWGFVVARPSGFGTSGNIHGTEYDPVRDLVYVWHVRTIADPSNDEIELAVYDVVGASWTDLIQADDTGGIGYVGVQYCRDTDLIYAARAPGKTGTVGDHVDFQAVQMDVAMFRGTARIAVRKLPRMLNDDPAAAESHHHPINTIRFLGGAIYMLMPHDGNVHLLRTSDDFQTTRVAKMTDGPSRAGPGTELNFRIFMGRVKDKLYITALDGTEAVGAGQRGYHVGAPFFAGVIPFADFTDQSCAEALRDLAILTNCIFWVDDDLQGHFVARDLAPQGVVREIADRILERDSTALWDQVIKFVKVSGGDSEETAGDAAFAAGGLELTSPFIPNDAYALALADSLLGFYGLRRSHEDIQLDNPDDEIFIPLERLTIEGKPFFVYESDHDVIDKEVRITLLEVRD